MNQKKKHDVQDKLTELHNYHMVAEKILQLAEDFDKLDKDESDGRNFLKLVGRYQTLDKILAKHMISTAKR